MPLLTCPECGHDVSSAAVACPSCGKPLRIDTPPPRPVIVAEPTRDEGIPPWALAAMGIAAVGLLILAFVIFTREDDSANSNLRVNVDRDRPASSSSRPGESDTAYTSVPGSSTTIDSSAPASQTTVPGSQADVDLPPDKGSVRIAAKVVNQSGSPTAVRNEKFYLLEKSLEEILDDAGLEPIEGNTLTNSLGLAIMYPERFGDFRQKAMSAINAKLKYSGTTDSNGNAMLNNVEPGSYYLFGVTKTGKGFAMWSSPVSVIAGENKLDLPARVTEMAG
jgi:hypothetical protein